MIECRGIDYFANNTSPHVVHMVHTYIHTITCQIQSELILIFPSHSNYKMDTQCIDALG